MCDVFRSNNWIKSNLVKDAVPADESGVRSEFNLPLAVFRF